MSKYMITLMIVFIVLLSLVSYCFAEETPVSRPLSPGKLRETFNLIAWIIILFGLTIALIGRILNRRRRKYSHSGEDFGGDFKESSGGIYFGDSFRGIGGKYFS